MVAESLADGQGCLVAGEQGFKALIGNSPAMERLRARGERVAKTPLPILIQGETGTGKEVLARAIHEASGRRGPFVAVDCAALNQSLVESELFGHVRGAFTGAARDRDGLVAAADGGTLFLDEVAELPLEMQTRLLRLVQEGTWRPVGGDEERSGEIRVLAASWRDLRNRVSERLFREDLYHRLAVIELELPPLRDRGADVTDLAEHFLRMECERVGRGVPELSHRLRQHLAKYRWPGNIRELKHAMSYLAVVPTSSRVEVEDLPPRMIDLTRGQLDGGPKVRTDLPYLEARRAWLDTFQARYVQALLEEHGGNVSAAARAANLDRRTIQRIRSKLLIEAEAE